MKVAVGSKNPTKIEGVVKAYEFFGIQVEVVPTEVESNVSRQPRSLEETVKGALVRATRALLKVPDAEHGVGVESGLMHIPFLNRIVDVTVAVIADRDGKLTVGLSPAFELPPEIVRKLYGENTELEEVVESITGIESIGEKGGFISYLTDDRYVRSELVRQAVIMALVPRLCPIRQMYGFTSHST